MSASRPVSAVADPVVVPAGTTCADAVAAAGLPLRGPKAVVVVRDPNGQLRDLSWAPEVETTGPPEVETNSTSYGPPDHWARWKTSAGPLASSSVMPSNTTIPIRCVMSDSEVLLADETWHHGSRPSHAGTSPATR